MDWTKSVFRITSSKPDCSAQGTGFACHQDKQTDTVFLVTCWHVVKTIEPGFLNIHGKKGVVVSAEGDDDLDLAVLSVQGIKCEKPFRLAVGARAGLSCETYGYDPIGRPLSVRLGRGMSRPHASDKDVPAWEFYLSKDAGALEQVEHGYSGAPVYDSYSRAVVAVLTHRKGLDKGFAIDICNLPRVWQTMPAGLLLDWPLRSDLRQLVADYTKLSGNPVRAERQLRLFAWDERFSINTLPAPGGPAAMLVDWLIGLGADDESHPVLRFARRWHAEVADRSLADRIGTWIDQAKAYFGVAEERQQSLVHRRTSSPPAVLVVCDEPNNSRTKGYPLRCFLYRSDQPLPVEFDSADPFLDPDAPARRTDLAQLINGVLNDCLVPRNKALLCFIVPDELLDHDFEHWAYPNDLGSDLPVRPLGTQLPVVVSLASRHISREGDSEQQRWKQGWANQYDHRDKPLADTWAWCNSVADVCENTEPDRVCIALTTTPSGRDNPLLRALLSNGVTATIWPRGITDAEAFKKAVEEKKHAATKLERLPWEVYRWRKEILRNKAHLCHQVTLLWDDWAYRLPQTDHRYLPGIDY